MNPQTAGGAPGGKRVPSFTRNSGAMLHGAVAGLPTEPPGPTVGLPPIPETFGPLSAGSETRAERESCDPG